MNYKKNIFPWRRIRRAPRNIYVVCKYFISFLIKGKESNFINIREVKGLHKSDTVYIIGTGPSLSTYLDDFVNDKQSMTLHMAFLKFPLTKYVFFTEADRLKY